MDSERSAATICRCGHEAKLHGKRLGDCGYCDNNFKFCKCNKFVEVKSNEENAMPKAAKVKKVKEAKKLDLYAATSKESKTLADKENKKRTAAVYQSVIKIGPASLDAIFLVAKTLFGEFRGAQENIRGNVRTMLNDLIECGLVKIVKE